MTVITTYRSIFISDWHMGAKTFHAPLLLDFLRRTESDTIYLVGDIIDGWKLNQRWHWPDIYNAIFDELFRKQKSGTRIVYIPGNHDETIRALPIWKRLKLHITIANSVTHTTANGRKYLVIHGDQFDRRILRGGVSRFGDRLYDFLLEKFPGHGPMIEVKGRMKRFSLAKALNTTGNWALNLLNNFEVAALDAAHAHHTDGVICGHTHLPALFERRGLTYANCGGWLRNVHTALVEHQDGELALLDWHQPDLFYDAAMGYTASPETLRLMATIRTLWPVTKPQSFMPLALLIRPLRLFRGMRKKPLPAD